jgi:two-component system response regulator DegU
VLKVLVTDDHPLFREGLRRALDLAGMRVVGEAGDGSGCLGAVARLRPDLVVLDMSLPGGGVDLLRALKSAHPELRVFVLTMHDDAGFLMAAVQAGADGYATKDVEPDELCRAIQACGRGERYLQPTLAGKLMGVIGSGPSSGPLSVLSEREWAILQLLARGCSNQEVGRQLFISEKTVKNHASNLFRKIGARDRTQAVVEAVKRGWIHLS